MTKTTGKAPAAPRGKKAAHTASRSTEAGQFLAAKGATPGAGFLSKTRLKKAGGSLVMTVPASARNLLHLTEGQEMAVTVEGSKVVLEPIPLAKPLRVRRPKYTLDELVQGYDPDAPLSGEEREWMDAAPVGRELW